MASSSTRAPARFRRAGLAVLVVAAFAGVTATDAPRMGPVATSPAGAALPPTRLGHIDVRGTTRLSNVRVKSITVHAGGRLVADRIVVEKSLVVLPRVGAPTSQVHVSRAIIAQGVVVNVIDGAGNLYWGSPVAVDLVMRESVVYQPQGRPGDHTEALAAFGWPMGARFERTAFVQQGPNNQTATATVNWHGRKTVFDGCWFAWLGPPAAHYTVYVEGAENVVRNSHLARAGGYVYPDSRPQATYVGNRDLASGAAILRR